MMDNNKTPFTTPAVAKVYEAMPPAARKTALALRELLFEVAADTARVGTVEETLRWGQPSYITPETKSGSTLRIGATKAGEAAIYAHCGTTIISTYAATFPDMDRIEGNRAVIFASVDAIVPERLRLLIKHGLTYHLKLE